MHNYAHLLAIDDLDRPGLNSLLKRTREMRWSSFSPTALAGKNIVLIFEKPSLRTRVTFEVAVRRLGGWPVLLDGGEARLGARESVEDMARNLSLWVDAIVARVYSHESLRKFADFSSVPVINALSDWEHPCQAVADLVTLIDRWGTLEGRTLVYLGDWNNVARSLWKASSLAGLQFRAIGPEKYGPAAGESVDWSTDIRNVAGADAVYTDAWASMGQESEFEERIPIFKPYQVNEALLARTEKPTVFMHCLPAHRGLEVTDTVMDSDQSLVFEQAANRLPAEMAVLISLLERSNEATYQEGRPRLFRGVGHLNHYSMAQGKLRL